MHVVAKHPKPPKARGVGPDVACCPAEAVAEAARHAGWAVSREDVLDLYARCADGPTGGFTIAAALTAGLPGVPMVFESAGCLGQLSLAENGAWPSEPTDAGNPPTLILGVDSPGPHAVTVAPDGCWVSWGQHFDPEGFPDAVIEEAWEVIFPWAA